MDTENLVKAENQPLVSIGIPTYNRLCTLQRTMESALKQDYRPLEIVISDNASDDGTEEFCRKIVQENQAVKYFRQPHNRGGTENFRQVLKQASGHFFMWLCDDDWIEPNYVSECTKFLLAHPDYVLASGTTWHHNEEIGAFDNGEKMDIPQENGPERVISFYRQVQYNTVFFGLIPKKLIKAIGVKPQLAGDWLMVASLAFAGKVKTIATTTLHRTINTGISRNKQSLLTALNLPMFFNKNYLYTSIGFNAAKDIFRGKSIYGSLSFFRRCRLALQVFAIIFRQWNIPREIKRTPIIQVFLWSLLRARLWALLWALLRPIRPPYRLLKKCFFSFRQTGCGKTVQHKKR